MSFGSNVQPKRRPREATSAGFCRDCNAPVAKHLSKCLLCGGLKDSTDTNSPIRRAPRWQARSVRAITSELEGGY